MLVLNFHNTSATFNSVDEKENNIISIIDDIAGLHWHSYQFIIVFVLILISMLGAVLEHMLLNCYLMDRVGIVG